MQRRLIDLYKKCVEYQDEWSKINAGLKLIPEHERKLHEIDNKFNEIEKSILEINYKLSDVDEIPDKISKSISTALIEPNLTIKQIKERQEGFLKVKNPIVAGLAIIGIMTLIFVIGNLGVDQFMKLITGITPKP